MSSSTAPIVGITTDIAETASGALRVQAAMAYCDSVRRAGGLPFLLPPIVELIPAQIELCRAFVFTGGDDPRTEPFGVPTHPAAALLHPFRQEYETALLNALNERVSVPVLGVCLGMQMMALTRGGRLNQHIPDTHSTHAQHAGDSTHTITPQSPASAPAWLKSGVVTSKHHQAVADPGALRAIATAPDGIIEAIDDPGRSFYVGVQWHPERTKTEPLGVDLFRSLVHACRD